MTQTELIIFVIKLVLGGGTAFFAILLWSRTGDAAWMSMIAGIVVNYAGLVLELLDKMGIISLASITLMNLPVMSIAFSVIPSLFFILSFVLMIMRDKR